MATRVLRRRGSESAHQNFIGEEAEFTFDTTLKNVRIHDGVTAGGFLLVRRDEYDAEFLDHSARHELGGDDELGLDTSQIVTGLFADARISESNVKQHTTADSTENTVMRRDANGRTQVESPDSSKDAANKDFVESLLNGLDWQESVIDQQGRPPVAPVETDRYLISYVAHAIITVDTTGEIVIVSGDQTTDFAVGDTFTINGSTGNDGTYTVAAINYDSTNDETDITVNEDLTDATADGNIRITVGAWNGHRDSIAEWLNSSWTFIAPDQNFALIRESDDTALRWNGTRWVNFGSAVKHNVTQGLQGGQESEYYHLTDAEHASVQYMIQIALDGLTADEVTQLSQIGNVTISNTQWGYLGVMDQDVSQSASVEFASITQGGNQVLDTTNKLRVYDIDGTELTY